MRFLKVKFYPFNFFPFKDFSLSQDVRKANASESNIRQENLKLKEIIGELTLKLSAPSERSSKPRDESPEKKVDRTTSPGNYGECRF